MTITEEPIEKTPRDRSPSFPFISLKAAIIRLVEFDVKFGRQEPTADRSYLAWEMKGNTSQAGQTLAALKSFGLIEYKGTGDKRLVSISEIGRKYLRAQQESVKKDVLKKVALSPKWIAHFWQKWGTDRVPDEIRLDSLVLENKFNENAAPNFLKVYDDTIVYAGLSDSDKAIDAKIVDDEDDLPPPAVNIGDLVQVEINGAHQLDNPKRVRAVKEYEGQNWVFIEGSDTGIPMEHISLQSKGADQSKPLGQPPVFPETKLDDTAPKGSRKEVTSLDEGVATLTWPDNLTPASVEDLELWLNGVLRKARRTAGLPVVNYVPGTLQSRSLLGGAGLPKDDEKNLI